MVADPIPTFAALLRRYRLAAGLTQEALAERAGLSVEAIGALERGTRTAPHRDTIARLAEALGLTAADRARLAAAAPNARTAAVHSGFPPLPHLPAPLTGFVGRRREVAAVRELLAQARLVTLTGAGGVGKTRLALAVASDGRAAFAEGGVCFVPLAALRDPGLVLPAVARALGLREGAGAPLLDRLRMRLAGPATPLLLLDNAEHLADAAPALGHLLQACPRLRLLVTSRAPLRLAGEREFLVPPLGLPGPAEPLDRLRAAEAVQLFAARAADLAPGFAVNAENAPAIAAIVRRLDGLPLAIELAAAHLRALSPPALLAHLARPLPLLTGGARDLPARQRTLRETIAWSEDLLAESERALFRRLAVFAGGWTLPALAAVNGADVDAPVLEGLEALLAQSLVQRVPGDRFRLLEPIREYAVERLDASGEARAIRQRHAAFYLALAEEARQGLTGAAEGAWLDIVEVEHANLRAALQWLGSAGEPEAALRLVAALGLPWVIRGHAAEGLALARPLLALPEAATPIATRAKALRSVAFWSYAIANRGAFGEAIALYEAALAIWRELGDAHEVARTLRGLAVVEFYARDDAAARAHFEASVPSLRQFGDDFTLSSVLKFLAELALAARAEQAAEAYLEEAIAIQRRGQMQSILAESLLVDGLLHQRRGEHAAARTRYEEALAMMRALDNRNSLGYALDAVGGLAMEEGDLARARTAFDEMLAPLVGPDFTVRLSQALESHACLAAAEGRPARALRLAGAAEALGEVYGRERAIAERLDPVPWLAAARRALGAAGTAAWAEGRAWSADEAITYALGDSDSPPEHDQDAFISPMAETVNEHPSSLPSPATR